jgi:primosomal protein N' (replication factor Y)
MRVARRYRWQILLKFSTKVEVFPDLTSLNQYCPSYVSMLIDVDPLSID